MKKPILVLMVVTLIGLYAATYFFWDGWAVHEVLGRAEISSITEDPLEGDHTFRAHVPDRIMDALKGWYKHVDLILMENGVPLSNGKAPHGLIRDKGRGLYAFYKDFIIFSTSDNSDPRTNNRIYMYIVHITTLPHLGKACLLLAVVLTLAFSARIIRNIRQLPARKLLVLKISTVIVFFLLILAGIEGVFRLKMVVLPPRAPVGRMVNSFEPFLGFISGPNSSGSYILNFTNKNARGRTVTCQRSTNNFGFRADMDFSLRDYYTHKDHERIVLLSGGSAAAAAGATSDSKTIDARLQYYLNAEQDDFAYKVLNFGNGGWVSFQQFIGLELFGKQLDPDWLVVMDGRNDIAVCVANQEGAGTYMNYSLLKSYFSGYLEGQKNPSFYRGKFENWIIENSSAYRQITGKTPVYKKQRTFRQWGSTMVGRYEPVTWDDVETQLDFYLKNQRKFCDFLSSKTKKIISLQPLWWSYSELFDEHSLNELKEFAVPTPDASPVFTYSMKYFYRRAQEEMQKIANEYTQDRDTSVQYIYAGSVFPNQYDADGEYFVDQCHMTDQGQDRVAKLYAYMILRDDFPEDAEIYNEKFRDLLLSGDADQQ